MQASLKKYVKERDAMLKKVSVAELRKFFYEHRQYYSPSFIASFTEASDAVLEVTLHKMIVAAIKLPQKLRHESALWLVLHGYDPTIKEHR